MSGAWTSEPWPEPPSRRARVATVAAIVLVAGLATVGIVTVARSIDPAAILVDDGLRPRPPASSYFTPDEVGTRGDPANAGDLYGDRFTGDVQERRVGGVARLSGYTVRVSGVTRVPGTTFVDGATGDYLRIEVRIFNRDPVPQAAGALDLSILSGDVRLVPEAVGADRMVATVPLDSAEELLGAVYVYVGALTDDLYVHYHPAVDGAFSTSGFAVWQVPG